jgi:serine/threonine protein kinase
MHTSKARGSSCYRAPETLKEDSGRVSNKVDIWSLGCIMYELGVRRKAFNSDIAVFCHSTSGTKLTVELKDSLIAQDAEKITGCIDRMLELTASSRPSASALCTEFSQYCKTTTMELLFDAGAATEISSTSMHGKALQRAIQAGHINTVKMLLRQGADPKMAIGEDDWTALHWAAYKGQTEIVPILLRAGVDPTASTKNGWTALHLAAWSGDYDSVIAIQNTISQQAQEKDLWMTTLSKNFENKSRNAIDLVNCLGQIYSDDPNLALALGNECMRQKENAAASRAFDLAARCRMRIDDLTDATRLDFRLYCPHCGGRVVGHHYKCIPCGWNKPMCAKCKRVHRHSGDALIRIPSIDFAVDKNHQIHQVNW